MKKFVALVMALCMVNTVALPVLAEENLATATDQSTPAPVLETAAPAAETETTAAPAEETTAAPDAADATEAPEAAEAPAEATEAPAEEPETLAEATEAPAGTVELPAEAAPETPAEEAPAAEEPVQTYGPCYIVVDGVRQYGQLEDLIPLSFTYGATVIVDTESVIRLGFWTTEGIRNVRLAPDRTRFPDEGLSVIASAVSPDGFTEENVIYIWVADPHTAHITTSDTLASILTATDDDVLERDLRVAAAGYAADSACMPTFTLSAIPEQAEGETYAVITDDKGLQLLPGDTFAPAQSGTYRFALVDEAGTVLARSAAYPVTYGEPEEAPAEETPAEEAPAEETLAEEAPAEEVPAEETPAEEAPVEEVPVEEAPAEEAPVEEAPTEETPAEEAPTEEPESPTLPDELTIAPQVIALEVPTLLSAGTVQVATESDLPEVAEYDIIVTAEDLNEGITADIAPTFHFSGAAEDQSYGVSVDGGNVTALNGAIYTAAAEGAYTLTFHLLDAQGAVLASSRAYSLDLDFSTESSVRKQAYYVQEDGAKVYGTLSGLLSSAAGHTIWVLTSDTIVLSGELSQLSGVALAPDPGVFATGTRTVVVTTVNPATATESAGSVYVYVGSVSSAAETGDTATAAATPSGYASGAWQPAAPSFALTQTSEKGKTYTWAVSFGGGTAIRLSGSSYTAGIEGAYTLTFHLLDEAGRVVASTQSYPVQLDKTAPLLTTSTKQPLTLTVTGGDTGSGVTGVSVNSGTTWYEPTKTAEGVWSLSFTASTVMTFAPGTIRVMDAAGNVTVNDADVTLTAAQSTPSRGGSMGGGSTGTVATTHASSDVETVTAYNGVDLVVDTGSMTVLTVGDTPLDLSLILDSTDAVVAEDYAPSFSASFSAWSGDADDAVDTLVLTASEQGITALPEDYAFTWEFTGNVYKKLAASGIDRLVLQVGDSVTVLSTAGFSAGVRYSMYRAEGLASKEFTYRVTMREPDGSMTMNVTVAGQTYEMTGDTASEFYYYDVLSGKAEALGLDVEG